MINIFMPLKPENTLQIPDDPIALAGWIIWFGVLIFFVLRYRNRQLKFNLRTIAWFAVLSVLVLVFSAFFGSVPRMGEPIADGEMPVYHLMFFAAVPWMVAGGLLGLLPAVLLAGLSGLLLAYLDTHNIFTPLLFMTVAVFYNRCIWQRYQTVFFRFIRVPIIAAIVSFIFTLPLVYASLVLSTPGSLALRFATASGRLLPVGASFAGMVLIGGILSLLFWVFARKTWGSDQPLKPAPGETQIKFHLIATTIPVLLILLIALAIANLSAAEKAVKRLWVGRLTSAANSVAEGLPVFIETGENLMATLAAKIQLTTGSAEDIQTLLVQSNAPLSYFEDLAVIDFSGRVIATFPEGITSAQPTIAGRTNLADALENVSPGTALMILPTSSGDQLQRGTLNFIARIDGLEGAAVRFLWGQTDLASNPLSRPLIGVLEDLHHHGGSGQIIGSEGEILYHSDLQGGMLVYDGVTFNTPTYFEGRSLTGEETVQFFHPVGESGWSVVVAVPAGLIRTTAWETALPTLLIGALAISGMLVIVLVRLTPLLKDVNQIKAAVDKLAAGDFEISLEPSQSVGEMRTLTAAFSDMTASLKSQIDNQADLLRLNDRMSGQLEVGESLEIILSAALKKGVSSVRVVLPDRLHLHTQKFEGSRFGQGKHAGLFEMLDDAVIALVRKEGALVLPDFKFGKHVSIVAGMPFPASMMAMPIQGSGEEPGVLWVTYQELKNPDDNLIKFFRALVVKLAETINQVSEVSDSLTARRQLEAVLGVLTEPVVLVDRDGIVIYHNAAARDWFEIQVGGVLSTLLTQAPLKNLMNFDFAIERSIEVRLDNGKSALVTISPISLDHWMGFGLVFKDITQNKREESLRSEIVTTVSHELRSPLTLIHGYAKILRLTGNLNEQQDTYVENIIEEVEEMRCLVQNLLDISRLDTEEALKFSRTTATEVAKRAIESLEAQARQKNIHIQLLQPENSTLIEADETFLVQALKNLIENGIKFSKVGQDVKFVIQPQEASVVFSVKDDGIGIAPLDQRHLFKPFWRAGTSAGQEQQGCGLGLAIVASVAERHGGKVWFESQLGQGSTFYLQIPLIQRNR